jgi:hypothetical protein
MREHRRERLRKVSTYENFRKFSITTSVARSRLSYFLSDCDCD